MWIAKLPSSGKVINPPCHCLVRPCHRLIAALPRDAVVLWTPRTSFRYRMQSVDLLWILAGNDAMKNLRGHTQRPRELVVRPDISQTEEFLGLRAQGSHREGGRPSSEASGHFIADAESRPKTMNSRRPPSCPIIFHRSAQHAPSLWQPLHSLTTARKERLGSGATTSAVLTPSAAIEIPQNSQRCCTSSVTTRTSPSIARSRCMKLIFPRKRSCADLTALPAWKSPTSASAAINCCTSATNCA